MERIESTLKKLLEKEGKIIKNAKIFERGYLPQSLVETERMISLFREIVNIVKYERSKNILVCGEPGTGKTVAVRVAQRIIRETLKGKDDKNEFFYVNCRDKTAVEILGNLLGKDPSGHSEVKLTENFIGSIHENNLNLTLILDEIDRAEKITNLLYTLSRTKEVFPSFSGSISLILLANDKKWEEELDKPVRSSLQLKTLIFGLYSMDKLERILQDRVNDGFFSENNITRKKLCYISKFTVGKKGSDARFAIESLFRSAQRAEEKGREIITDKDIESSFITVEEDLERERITTLSTNQFLVLYSCSTENETNFSEAYKKYMEYVKEFRIKKVKRIGKTRFRRIIDYLENQSLLKKIVIAHEIGKREMELRVKIKREVLNNEYNQRLQKTRL